MSELTYPTLPCPLGLVQFAAEQYEDAWTSSMEAYGEEQMLAYAEPLLRRIKELEKMLAENT
jgi:hypothetical protein